MTLPKENSSCIKIFLIRQKIKRKTRKYFFTLLKENTSLPKENSSRIKIFSTRQKIKRNARNFITRQKIPLKSNLEDKTVHYYNAGLFSAEIICSK